LIKISITLQIEQKLGWGKGGGRGEFEMIERSGG